MSDVCDMKGCTGKPLMCICSDCWRKQMEEIERLKQENYQLKSKLHTIVSTALEFGAMMGINLVQKEVTNE